MTALADPLADAFWATSLRRWNAVCWALFGAMAVGLVTAAPPGGSKYKALALLGCVVLCYAVLDRFPGNPVVRPQVYLSVLVLVLGGLAYLGSSYAALFMVTLPHYWMFGRTPRASMGFLGAATGATLTGALVRQGWSAEFFGETLVSTLIVVAVGVLIGLWAHSVVAQSSERARLIKELERAQEELSEAHQRQGAADERERMARDIHDTLAQGFASIIVLAEAARAGMSDDPARSAQQLRSIESTARENLAEARELVGSATQPGPGRVAAGSVTQTLRRTLDRFAEDTGLAVDADLADLECDQQTRIALLRCTQESLANVRKHARASTVGVVLVRRPYGVELEITDDGTGFVVKESTGFGLDGMRKRLAELGGRLTVTSSMGDGTRILAMIPMASEVEA
ncbi:sensor histidine kinase [Streptomyces sp. NBC_01340]|uniref:sensor histidine kinase n=1 Tax=unclassified Streptomyces TaxID=2593676 RepID=UPI002252776D|nr:MULTISPECIES: sensor histidine kinase [unclassified Streptomyces]MCX4455607.1 sensor histidine kinase [Streptomyces sp. NBC_01719]MCX4494967.1 sensor histidine kinase [Streptomyces sp. NBC_01728]WSI39981.1 sensor histidine kinase [Streptomyces sp. NBC_01340]